MPTALNNWVCSLEYGLVTAKDEVDVTLDIVALVVVAADAVVECVLGAVEGAVVEGTLSPATIAETEQISWSLTDLREK
jgi:hypothetical protein